jgi:hypothetical protein
MALAVVRLWLLFALAAMLVTPSAGAAPKPATKAADKTKSEAARHLEAGDEALKAGDAATAIREYEAARAVKPSFEASLGLARAERTRGDNLKAREQLQSITTEFGSKLDEKQKGQLDAERTRVSAGIASLLLDVKEPGASVTLDGRSVGTTPLSAPIELNAGNYELSVKKAGFAADVRKLELTGGQNRVAVTLVRESKTSKLVITSQGSEPLTVFVNDQSVGTAPLSIDVAPGTYKISGKSAGKQAAPQTIQIELGQTTNVALAAADVPGTARVSAGDPEAVIFIDDRPVGKGDWQAELAPGPHQLRIERPGYEAHSQPLEIVAAERVIVDQVPYRAKGAADPEAYKGIFVNVALLGLFGVSPTNELAVDCPANSTGGGCTSTAPAGGGLGVRVGYQYGWVGFEGIVLGSVDASTTEASYEFGTPPELGDYYGVARDEKYAFIRYGFGGGVGARFASEDKFLRFTGGLSGIVMWRTAQYTRATNSTEGIPDAVDDNSETESYVNPGAMTDIGVMIGNTPGIKFHAGITFLVEFAPNHVPVPGIESRLGGFMPEGPSEPYGTPEVDVSREAQFMFGPFLAMQIGR